MLSFSNERKNEFYPELLLSARVISDKSKIRFRMWTPKITDILSPMNELVNNWNS